MFNLIIIIIIGFEVITTLASGYQIFQSTPHRRIRDALTYPEDSEMGVSKLNLMIYHLLQCCLFVFFFIFEMGRILTDSYL